MRRTRRCSPAADGERSRRKLSFGLALSSIAPGLSVIPSTDVPYEEREPSFEPKFPTTMTIDIIEKGADPTCDEPIDDVLDDVMSDGATVEFPPGTYRVDCIETDHDDLKLVGTNATLVPTNRQECTNVIDATGNGFVFDGFELDFRDVAYPPRFDVQADDWQFSNVVVRVTAARTARTWTFTAYRSCGRSSRARARPAPSGTSISTRDPARPAVAPLAGRSS